MLAGLSDWFAATGRDLPWRHPDRTPWGVLVSEVMLQQTPVARVLPAWAAWTARWPDPAAQAEATPAEVLRQWGRLGYPRRALRLREAAVACVECHDGRVPAELAELLALPGVGAYTARAVAAFGFGQRQPVVDTNVARVLHRAVLGADDPRSPSAADRRVLEALLPEDPAPAVRAGAALMELGALVCTAARPRCADCPLQAGCAWRAAGSPRWQGATARPQGYAGSDRQVRGLLLGRLRDSEAPVPAATLLAVWSDREQGERAMAGLLADGLAQRAAEPGSYRLPG